jgi:hypothetical protein
VITFETKNSIYSITILPNGLVSVLKTAEINPNSQWNKVGQSRLATGFSYNSMNRMFTFFTEGGQDWHTSPVQRLL